MSKQRLKTKKFELYFLVPKEHLVVLQKNNSKLIHIGNLISSNVRAHLTTPFEQKAPLSVKPFKIISLVLSLVFEKNINVIIIACEIDRYLRTRNRTPFLMEYFYKGEAFIINPTLRKVRKTDK